MSDKSKLAALYAAIPTFACLDGCSDCCGPVPIAAVEWKRISLAKRAIGVDCLSCVYLIDARCAIYEDRPYLCRLFGATVEAKLLCPHGCGPAVPLTKKQTDVLTAKYMKLSRVIAMTSDLP